MTRAEKEGKAHQARMLFCQRSLGREEFEDLCARLRRNEMFWLAEPLTEPGGPRRIGHEVETWGRIRFSPAELEVIPASLPGSQGGIWRTFRAGWSFPIEGNVVDLGQMMKHLARLQEMNLTRTILACHSRKGGLRATIEASWGKEPPTGVPKSIFLRLAPYSEASIYSWDLIPTGFPPTGYLRFALRRAFPFLEGVLVRNNRLSGSIPKPMLQHVWESLQEWCLDPEAIKENVVDFGVAYDGCTDLQWDPTVFAEVLRATNAESCVVDANASCSYRNLGPDGERAYHQWLAKLVGKKSFSGAAVRGQIAVCSLRGRDGGLEGYFGEHGVCLAYYLFSGKTQGRSQGIGGTFASR